MEHSRRKIYCKLRFNRTNRHSENIVAYDLTFGGAKIISLNAQKAEPGMSGPRNV